MHLGKKLTEEVCLVFKECAAHFVTVTDCTLC